MCEHKLEKIKKGFELGVLLDSLSMGEGGE